MSRGKALSGFVLLAILVGIAGGASGQQVVGHSLRVGLDPATHRLSASDTITLHAGTPALEFLLNADLAVVSSVPAAREMPLGDIGTFFGAAGPPATPFSKLKLRLKRYRVEGTAAAPLTQVVLRYEGALDYGLGDIKEEYTRGFRETPGILDARGVFLAGSSFWVPTLGPDLFTFQMEVNLPAAWHVISQGNGTSRDAAGIARWDSNGPTEEAYLVGGPLEVYRDSAGAVETLVYLHEKDEALASKYLAATAQYVEMYRGLLGPYPYKKFALVENFWETGYGMPSFTLLGPQVIRFPFILTSSYPHEILHNWWGNSVFVEESAGNWSEGLTAYLADFLIQEDRGKGDEYRRATLQKYRDYVKAGRDFPLSQFRARDSAATEAVGYGKALMGFHMLRRKLGDETFRKALVRFYRDWKGKKASFRDLQKTFETVSGASLAAFFDPLLARPGAPELSATVTGVVPKGDAFEVTGILRQTQKDPPFTMDVPVVVQTDRGADVSAVTLTGRETPFAIRAAARPRVVHVDPWFDTFRRLDARETPPSIGQIFGEPGILAVLSATLPPDEIAAYRALLEAWKSGTHVIEVRLDSELSELPKDRSAWLLGRENRFASPLFAKNRELAMTPTNLSAGGETIPLARHSVVLVARHPGNPEKAVGWIFAAPAGALPGLSRKLPHYGKYSYLGFEGDEPTNVLKGQWEASDSPMRVDLRGAGSSAPVAALLPEPRKALASPPPVFSQKALSEHVAFLAAPERMGRGIGTKGLDEAAEYVASKFTAMGLAPGGDAGTYLQSFQIASGPEGKPVAAANVIGVLAGTKSGWKDQSVVVSAHLDHLGNGWPDVRAGNKGKIHPGADDNASGVAVLLELAKLFATGEKPKRTIVFAVWSGEEAGRLGSKHYVEHPAFPLAKTMGVINLDTVGRLFDQKLSVLGTGTASEWQHIFRGASFVTGVDSKIVPESAEGSDQLSFIEKGVPAVQIFSGAHADYHRPSDTADKIDGAGLVKVATFVKEGVAYLAERPEPLTNTIPKAAAPARAPADAPPTAEATGAEAGAVSPTLGRRVTFGTVPDFEFPGPGVKVTGVVPGSPAETAGVKEGDILLAIDGAPIENLRGYADLLKTFSPGQSVKTSVKRGGEVITLRVTLVER